jgi:hypothetical protein
LITRTVDSGGGGITASLIVQVSVSPSVAGDVTEKGPPEYGWAGSPPHWIVAV